VEGNAEVRGSLDREVIRRVVRRNINQVRFCYERELAARPGLAGDVNTQFIISADGKVQGSAIATSTLGNARVETCITQAIRGWQFPSPSGGGIVVVDYPFTFSGGGGGGGTGLTYRLHLHQARRCSDAAGLLLDDRRAIWTERLGSAGNPAGWVAVYEEAKRKCETPSLRDRRALLTLILRQAGGVQQMIQVYRHLSDSDARTYLRSAILRRVRSPEDLRAVRDAFDVSRIVDEELVKQVIERATDGPGRIRAIRGLIAQFPFSFELKLRLLEELETQGRIPEAKRLAHQLRSDPLADPGVRTAIGEMYLRVGDEVEARRVFSEIVEFAPLDELARRRLGDLYRAHGWYEEAYRQYQTLAEIRPDDPGVMLFLAQAAAGAGRIDEALRLEQRVAETAEPGESFGVARAAILWSSVRFAKLRERARADSDDERMEALLARMRRSGVLREAGDFRVTLHWSHPDAALSLWAAHPGLGLSRPTDIAPEYGIEAFDVREREDGRYKIEVRRGPPEQGQRATELRGELVVIWNEGTPEEVVRIVPFTFPPPESGSPPTLAQAWTIHETTLSPTDAEGWPERSR
jgi:Ca-activated chloride channel family protein